ncbi:MAG: L-cystine transport system permease protein YecS [Candidatus Anoxychlamydiales bacterium]|nr:L-cystine transport system permease protein YecS [Candidatus Anoxychlamydiales bacterium]
MINFSLIIESLPTLSKGVLVTLQISFFASIFGFFFGLILGFLNSTKNRLINSIVTTYVTIIRGTPMLVQIIMIFYLLPALNINISPVSSAMIAIGINSSAYVSQIIRSGISSVSVGQIEAAKVLGLNKFQTALLIVLPQAIRITLPTLSNEFITLIKDSSLASIIGVMELSKQGSIIRSRTYDAFSILFIVAAIYLFMTSLLTFIMKRVEKKMRVYVKNN